MGGGVCYKLIEAGHVGTGQAAHRTIVVHADEDAPACGVAEGNDLGRQSIGINNVGLELVTAVLAPAEQVDQLCGFHRL